MITRDDEHAILWALRQALKKARRNLDIRVNHRNELLNGGPDWHERVNDELRDISQTLNDIVRCRVRGTDLTLAKLKAQRQAIPRKEGA